MSRIEPTLGELEPPPEGTSPARARREHRTTPAGSAAAWAINFLLVTAIAAGGPWLAQRSGLVTLPDSVEIGDLTGRVLVVGGLLFAWCAQLVGTLLLFARSAVKGFLSLVIPGYFCLALKREGLYAWIIGAFFAGIAGLAAGTIMLS